MTKALFKFAVADSERRLAGRLVEVQATTCQGACIQWPLTVSNMSRYDVGDCAPGRAVLFFYINRDPRTLALKKHIAHGREMGLTGSLLAAPHSSVCEPSRTMYETSGRTPGREWRQALAILVGVHWRLVACQQAVQRLQPGT